MLIEKDRFDRVCLARNSGAPIAKRQGSVKVRFLFAFQTYLSWDPANVIPLAWSMDGYSSYYIALKTSSHS